MGLWEISFVLRQVSSQVRPKNRGDFSSCSASSSPPPSLLSSIQTIPSRSISRPRLTRSQGSALDLVPGLGMAALQDTVFVALRDSLCVHSSRCARSWLWGWQLPHFRQGPLMPPGMAVGRLRKSFGRLTGRIYFPLSLGYCLWSRSP